MIQQLALDRCLVKTNEHDALVCGLLWSLWSTVSKGQLCNWLTA
jgi:hypothetical protein